MNKLIETVSYTDSINEKITALNQLGRFYLPQAIEMLKINSYSSDPQIRQVAIISLREIASNGYDKDGSIKDVITQAVYDEDEQIASIAKNFVSVQNSLSLDIDIKPAGQVAD